MVEVARLEVTERSDNIVTEQHFGANILFDRDRFDDGTYDDAIEELGITHVRYPGGSMTEWYFDITDPDQTYGAPGSVGGEAELLPLSDFLRNATEAGVSVSIVIPTIDALEPGSLGQREVSADYVRDVERFIERVLDGEFGDANITSFEIGNEYWGSGEMNSVEYGKVANALSIAIQDVLDANFNDRALAETTEEPEIAVQYGQWGAFSQHTTAYFQNMEIINELSVEAREAIDAVIAHYYHRNSYEDIETDSWVFDRLNYWTTQPYLTDVEFHLTEWNISSSRGSEFGLRQAPAILEMFQRMVSEGVDAAQIWPIQQNNRTELFGNEGDVAVTAAGQMFNLMSSSLIGMKPLEIDGPIENLEVNAFANDDSLELFVHWRGETSFEGAIDFSELLGEIGGYGHIANAVVLSSDGASDDPDTLGYVNRPDDLILYDQLRSQDITIELNPFEVARISIEASSFIIENSSSDIQHVVTNGQGLTGTNTSDVLVAEFDFANLSGEGGDDRLYAHADNVTMAGGAGSDEFEFGVNSTGASVLDFEAGVDQLDLLQFAKVSGLFSLQLEDQIQRVMRCFDVPKYQHLTVRVEQGEEGAELYLDAPGSTNSRSELLATLIGVDRSDLDSSDFIF